MSQQHTLLHQWVLPAVVTRSTSRVREHLARVWWGRGFNRKWGRLPFCQTLRQSGLRVPFEFAMTTHVRGSSWGWLWLRHSHVNPSRLAGSHAGQNWHSHRLGSSNAQPVDGGSWTSDRGGGWRPVLNNCCRGAYLFSGSILGSFLSSCS